MHKKNKKYMKKLSFQNNAVVGIVSAFLIIGLIVTVLSVFQITYVPKMMKEKEAEHMNKVAEQFAQLKYAIDTHSSTKQETIPISTSITLGSREHTYFLSVRAFGSLNIVEKDVTISIKNNTDTFTYSLGSIKYQAHNAYYVRQNYIHEAGSVILDQEGKNIVTIKPPIQIDKQKNVSIYYDLINISTIGEKSSISGFGTYPIQTEYIDTEYKPNIEGATNFTIITKYSNAWYNFLDKTLIKSGLNYNGPDTNYTIQKKDDKVIILFTGSTILNPLTINVYMDIINIGAQVAPGWVENTK